MNFEDSNYKIRQYKYEQAIKVLITEEPKQTIKNV